MSYDCLSKRRTTTRFEDLTEVLLKIRFLIGATLCTCIYQISAAC